MDTKRSGSRTGNGQDGDNEHNRSRPSRYQMYSPSDGRLSRRDRTTDSRRGETRRNAARRSSDTISGNDAADASSRSRGDQQPSTTGRVRRYARDYSGAFAHPDGSEENRADQPEDDISRYSRSGGGIDRYTRSRDKRGDGSGSHGRTEEGADNGASRRVRAEDTVTRRADSHLQPSASANGDTARQTRSDSPRRTARPDSGSQKVSRSSGAEGTRRKSKPDRHKKHRTARRVAIVVACALAAAGVAFGIFVHVLNANLSANLGSGLNNVLVKKSLTKEPFYMVLLGTDQSIERETDSTTDGTYRTDSIVLARVDAPNKKVTLVSLPRDTQVDMEGYGTHKLNAAYAYGGSALAVKTISDLCDEDVSHFALIDMDGLTKIVDSLGGIDVNVPIEIDDDEAGGHLDAGEQTLNGEQTLILARSRHSYDDYGNGDEFRAANQRLVLGAIADKVLSSDVATLASTATALSDCVQTDLSVSDITSLAQALRGIDTSTDIYSATMPTTSAYENGVWVEYVDQDSWDTMRDRIDQGLPPTESSVVDASTGTVLASAGDGKTGEDKSGDIVVRNGSGYSGLGNEVASTLTNAGYTVTDTGNADSFDYASTLVIYSGADKAAQASAIAKTIGHNAKARANDGSYKTTGDFLVIVGSNYRNYTS